MIKKGHGADHVGGFIKDSSVVAGFGANEGVNEKLKKDDCYYLKGEKVKRQPKYTKKQLKEMELREENKQIYGHLADDLDEVDEIISIKEVKPKR